jgi:hypothetical protein
LEINVRRRRAGRGVTQLYPRFPTFAWGVGGRAAEELDGGWWHSMKEVDDGCSGFDEVRWRICVGDQCG